MCLFTYHTKCINDWLDKSKSCPTCRKKYINYRIDDENSHMSDAENIYMSDDEYLAAGWRIFVDPESGHEFWHRRSVRAEQVYEEDNSQLMV